MIANGSTILPPIGKKNGATCLRVAGRSRRSEVRGIGGFDVEKFERNRCGGKRRELGVIVGGCNFDYIHADQIASHELSQDLERALRRDSPRNGRSGSRSKCGVEAVDIERDIRRCFSDDAANRFPRLLKANLGILRTPVTVTSLAPMANESTARTAGIRLMSNPTIAPLVSAAR